METSEIFDNFKNLENYFDTNDCGVVFEFRRDTSAKFKYPEYIIYVEVNSGIYEFEWTKKPDRCNKLYDIAINRNTIFPNEININEDFFDKFKNYLIYLSTIKSYNDYIG